MTSINRKTTAIKIDQALYKFGKSHNDYPDKFKITYSCGIDNSTKRTIIVDSLMCTGSYLRKNYPELRCYSAKSINAVLGEQYKKGDFRRSSYIDQPGGFISPDGRVQFALGNEILPESHIELILPDEVNGVCLAGKNFEGLEKVFPLALQAVGPPVYLAAAYLAIVAVRSLLFKEGIDFQGILYFYGTQGNGKTTLAKSVLGVYRREGDRRPFGMVQAGSTFAAVEKYMVLLKDMPLIVDDLCLSASKDAERKRKDLDANLIRLGSGDVSIIKKRGNQLCESESNAGLVLTAEFTLENASDLSRCILVPVNKSVKLPEEICPELFGAALRKYVVWFSENYEEEIERLKRELSDSQCSPEERVSTNYGCLYWAFSGMLMSLGISTEARKKLMLQMAKALDKSLNEYTQLKTKLDTLIKKGNIAYILLKGYKNGDFDLANNIENLKKHGGVIWKNDLCLREHALVRFVRNQDGYSNSKKNDIVRDLNDYGALVIQEEGGYTVHLSKDPSACRVYRIRLDALKEHKEKY